MDRLRMIMMALLSAVAVFAISPAASAATITFQEGAHVVSSDGKIDIANYTGTRDTSLVQESSNNNYGGRTTILVGVLGSGRVRGGLVGFDVSALAGHYLTIDSMTLRLYVDATSAAGSSQTISVALEQAGNAGWVEGTANSATQTGSADWNYAAHTSGAWLGGTNGARTASDLYGNVGSLAVSATGTGQTGTFVDFTLSAASLPASVNTLTKIIELWLGSGGANNAGLLLSYGANVSNPQWQFASSESATASHAPQLIITYTVPTPAALPAGLSLIGLLSMRRRK